MAVILKKVKRIAAFAAALLTAAAIPCSTYADDEMIIEIIPETADTIVTVKPEKDKTKISPYIFGINDKGNIAGISPTVIKQTGTSLSTYNWETNFSNPGTSGNNSNDISLVDNFPSSKWSSPALYTDSLVTRGMMSNIPVRLVTLQLMGYVSKDSMGIVSDDALSKQTRWCTVQFHKNDTYLNQPDTDDDVVYMDEYVSYLVNRYGSAMEGGINGYFLDSEPDKWAENFSVLGLDQITPDELLYRSAELAYAVKTIDNKAFVFGPSVSGLQGCINLNNSDAWGSRSDNEYSWFIDNYLSYMYMRGDQVGYRLLDVLDLHYYTEALTPVGIPVLTSSDEFSNAYRMQAVRTLWDSDYTENSVSVLMNKQFTPLIPTLQASIRMNYPGTRLSFSEYDFGGGDNMSGAIAETDVLGTFAKEGVYLACLSPVSEDYSFQKAAMNLFTDYDGEGTKFGDALVYSDNDDDTMSSVYAAVDNDDPEVLRLILTNKNMVNTKNFNINIKSSQYDYELSEAYRIDENADIVNIGTDSFEYGSNTVSFDADTMSVYMLVLRSVGEELISEDSSESVWNTEASQANEDDKIITENPHGTTESVTVLQSSEAVTEDTNPADATVPDLIETSQSVAETVAVSATDEETAKSSDGDISEAEESDENGDEEAKTVATPVKVIVLSLAACVGAGIFYVLIIDKK